MVSSEIIERAARLIRQGKTVAFPTETVYGLGANALDEQAVARIYEIKGRPSTSPLIVHVHSAEMARSLVERWPDAADRLAAEFWPGPLTLVLRKHPRLPAIVTAGLDTVALRVPAHPVAQDIIRCAGLPVAAPSANRFSQLSPTTAEHVTKSLADAVDMIVDGGPANVGIESTVVSLAGEVPVLLRPGMISPERIGSLIGRLEAAPSVSEGAHPSPGMHQRHYSPATKLVLVAAGALPREGRGAYLWHDRQARGAELSVPMPPDPTAYAAMLYGTLHDLDSQGFDWIAVECPPTDSDWAGILDRLKRASADAQ